jgi:hypothetical protein
LTWKNVEVVHHAPVLAEPSIAHNVVLDGRRRIPAMTVLRRRIAAAAAFR